MVSNKVISKLNEQVLHEANASQSYLAMAIWADTKSLDGIAAFFTNNLKKRESTC